MALVFLCELAGPCRLYRRTNQAGKVPRELLIVINQYECGSVVPSNAVLGKLERCLGVKLRGKAAVTKGAKAKAGKAKR